MTTMAKFKAALHDVATSKRVRAELFDLAKIIAGVIAARYGIKLA